MSIWSSIMISLTQREMQFKLKLLQEKGEHQVIKDWIENLESVI